MMRRLIVRMPSSSGSSIFLWAGAGATVPCAALPSAASAAMGSLHPGLVPAVVGRVGASCGECHRWRARTRKPSTSPVGAHPPAPRGWGAQPLMGLPDRLQTRRPQSTAEALASSLDDVSRARAGSGPEVAKLADSRRACRSTGLMINSGEEVIWEHIIDSAILEPLGETQTKEGGGERERRVGHDPESPTGRVALHYRRSAGMAG